MIGQGLKPFSESWSLRVVDTCCAGSLFRDPESHCVQDLVWSLRHPIQEVVFLEIELVGRFLWGGKPPAHPSPKRQFPSLGIPACYQQGCLGWVLGSPWLGPVYCWVSDYF